MPYRSSSVPYEVRCQANVRDLGRWPSYHRCERKGVVEREGKLYCKQHDPVTVENARKKRMDVWNANMKARRIRFYGSGWFEGDMAEDGARRELEGHKLATWDILLEALNKVYDTTHDPAIELIAADAIDKARETR